MDNKEDKRGERQSRGGIRKGGKRKGKEREKKGEGP